MAFNQKEYSADYHKTKIRQIKFNFNKDYDKDVIDKLDEVENKQGYIKKLIRDDIRRG